MRTSVVTNTFLWSKCWGGRVSRPSVGCIVSWRPAWTTWDCLKNTSKRTTKQIIKEDSRDFKLSQTAESPYEKLLYPRTLEWLHFILQHSNIVPQNKNTKAELSRWLSKPRVLAAKSDDSRPWKERTGSHKVSLTCTHDATHTYTHRQIIKNVKRL